ncbi:hypothetical protein AAIA72_00910 [Hahella sp. SMD15-11]|uniref:Uncharacterized protein n=1 Tax=Thermohahella caldifontis TaxID=3142973 RepID=A0AB39UX89_9GAMM
MSEFVIWAACPSGLEYLLADELSALGVKDASAGRLGVRGLADWSVTCRALLETRLASRVFRVLAEEVARDADTLSSLAGSVDWQAWLVPDMPFWIHAQGHAGDLRHPHFAAQVVKDVIVDQFRAAGLTPPGLIGIGRRCRSSLPWASMPCWVWIWPDAVCTSAATGYGRRKRRSGRMWPRRS